jgi:Recombination endonuclease VII
VTGDGLVKYGTHPGVPPGSACEACGRVTPDPVADHCHAHGWVRGGLCRSCNTQMGYVDRGITPYAGAERTESLLAFRKRCPECSPLEVPDLVPESAWRAANDGLEAHRARGAETARAMITEIATRAAGDLPAQFAALAVAQDDVQRKIDWLAAERARAVAELNAGGMSYAQIAVALGMSRARAQQLCEAGRDAAVRAVTSR